jgi:hypothetical protein
MNITRFVCLALLLSLPSLTAAHATTVAVERDVPPTVSVAGASFDADRGRGQAWVVVDFVEHGGEEEQVYSERVPVPGLTYDAATRTIHLQDGDRDVTCAVGRRLLWATSFKPTSDCPLHVQQSPQAKVPSGEKTRFLIDVGTARTAG